MDVRLPDGSGIDACRTIRAAHPDTRVLFLTSFADDDAVLATILAGADGFLLKEVTSEQLIEAVEDGVVKDGQSWTRPSLSVCSPKCGRSRRRPHRRNGSLCRRKKNAFWHWSLKARPIKKSRYR